MRRRELVTLANMCMLTDGHGNVLVEDRVKAGWTGIAFPGGHVEWGESLTDSVIREMREETGLTIEHPRLVGVKDWPTEDGRYMVLLYRADTYSGTLTSSEEGRVFWTPIDSFHTLNLATDIDRDVRVFLEDSLSEHYFREDDQGNWVVDELK